MAGGRKRTKVDLSGNGMNGLFQEWLKEWKEEAAKKGNKMQYVLGKALESLKKYPLPVKEGRECLILEYFGASICKMLDARLEKYRTETGESMPSTSSNIRSIHTISDSSDSLEAVSQSSQPTQSERKRKQPSKATMGRHYIPTPGSGPFALLVTLCEHEGPPHFKNGMVKAELQDAAQGICDTSFTRPDSGSHYTAWSSMSMLVNRGLVTQDGRPRRYILTDNGRHLASQLMVAKSVPASNTEGRSVAGSELSQPTSQHSSVSTVYATYAFHPGCFDIVLLVDTAEIEGKRVVSAYKTRLVRCLQRQGILHEIRHLSVADFVWIARSGRQELVLPVAIERKRLDDLGKSIKDGRFREQKFRLKQSGVNKVIYLLEEFGTTNSQHLGLPLMTIQQAAVNTEVVDGFSVVHTSNLDGTGNFLAKMTEELIKKYSQRDLKSRSKQEDPVDCQFLSFSEFNAFSVKTRTFTVQEMFVRQLLQIHGLCVDKACAIVERYYTPYHLLQAYSNCNSMHEKETLLCKLHYGKSFRTIGIATSRVLAQFYSMETFSTK